MEFLRKHNDNPLKVRKQNFYFFLKNRIQLLISSLGENIFWHWKRWYVYWKLVFETESGFSIPEVGSWDRKCVFWTSMRKISKWCEMHQKWQFRFFSKLCFQIIQPDVFSRKKIPSVLENHSSDIVHLTAIKAQNYFFLFVLFRIYLVILQIIAYI